MNPVDQCQQCMVYHSSNKVDSMAQRLEAKPTSDDLFLSSALLEGSVMNRSVILEGFECFGEVLNRGAVSTVEV